jgi:DNA polymerase-3 subunit gamma/tau
VPSFSLIYRPQKANELDHQAAKSFFQDILKSGRVPQALLFSGPRGTGKTSAGRILAKILNCQKNLSWKEGKKLADACGECPACQEIVSGTYLDLVEIDAASNRGIDEIRDLREKIKLSPSQGRFKIYLIDEVHMLTSEAFNALLKTLEEPPPHAYFILATTQPDKLPETVRSRCVGLRFSRADRKEIKACLDRVVEQEKIKIKAKPLDLIARAADGSFRDAQKWLERLALKNSEITLEMTEELLSFGGIGSARHFLELLTQGDINKALRWLHDFVDAGHNVKELVRKLLDLVQEQLMYLSQVPDSEEVTELADLNMEELIDLAERFNRAGNEIRIAILPHLPLEIMVIEWGGGQATSGGNQGKETVQKEVPQSQKTQAQVRKECSDDQVKLTKKVQEKWGEILTRLKPQNGSITGLLRSCRVRGFDGRFLEIEAFYRFHHEKLQSERVRRAIEKVVSEVTGVPMKIRCILGEKPKKITKMEVANVYRPTEDLDHVVEFAERLFGSP